MESTLVGNHGGRKVKTEKKRLLNDNGDLKTNGVAVGR